MSAVHRPPEVEMCAVHRPREVEMSAVHRPREVEMSAVHRPRSRLASHAVRSAPLAALLCASVLLVACSDTPITTLGDGGLLDIVEIRPDAAPIPPATECVVTTASAATREAATHLTPCSDTVFDTTPPSEGPHYSSWAAFGVYDAPVPWGYLVHSLEHGAVVIAYACTTDCADVPARLRTFYDTYTPDPLCSTTTVPHRLIVVPAPDLDVPIAASAWGEIYRATCLDETSLRAFVDAHYARAPENFCSPGIDDSPGWCG